jgi:hypothetical protein
MTDRELLELAAKAAGVRHIEYTNDYNGCYGIVMCDEHGMHGNTWNPLTDDGDALRLAVTLDMVIDLFLMEVKVKIGWSYGSPNFYTEDIMSGDVMSAIRRAIVRAAAEIGKAMK